MSPNDTIDIPYAVVFNEEEQYSIWPTFKEVPPGWKKEGFSGAKKECLDHINAVWKDMRPLSLRQKIEERREAVRALVANIPTPPLMPLKGSETVSFLTQGMHPIRVHESESKMEEFEKALRRKTIHLIFEDTKGETCLRVDLTPDPEHARNSENTICYLKGFLELDLTPLICTAELDLKIMRGQGNLSYK